MMMDLTKDSDKVVSLSNKRPNKEVTLKDLLAEKDIEFFFKYIKRHDLRVEAYEMLCLKLQRQLH